MPIDCGLPLFLYNYFECIIHFVKENDEIPTDKKKQLLEYLNLYLKPSKNSTDLNLLLNIYQKWLTIFPFELCSYFGNIKETFEKQIPILKGVPEINQYTNEVKIVLKTKSELIETLIKLTNEILTKITGIKLLNEGLIKDSQEMQVDLIIQVRRQQIKEGYRNDSPSDEHRYKKMIKTWLRHEHDFWAKLAPLLKPNSKKENTITLKQIALVQFFDGTKVDRNNANEIARQYGKTSGESIYQDYIFWSSSCNRTGEDTSRIMKRRILDYEAIRKYLSKRALSRYEDELKAIKATYNKLYN